ncbi:DUF423 domain-containing protein [Rubripirellula reticaptiva]|uniref:DUF423 domain-containing protein n=1 Tax=Rubripirellula reticaptiva TaxID=2528013 RepID=A0A5C6F6D3_9BACT|nr:DUF423 domain-containing protein [Rubripirellula reticaptiva]TWU56130.1 hypothetical protein Poly59_24340 [Rubripirellula reticaptiva]
MLEDSASQRILIYGAILGATGVAFGAIGAHFLPEYLANQGMQPDLVEKRTGQFDIGARYQLVHAVVLVALAGLPVGPSVIRRWIGRLFVVGTVIFSGSLYAIAITNISKFGLITPLGGLTWISAWCGLIWIAREGRRKEKRFHQIRGRMP